MDLTTASPQKFLKFTFFNLLTFWKNPGCYSLPHQKNLVLEIKGLLGLRKGEGY